MSPKETSPYQFVLDAIQSGEFDDAPQEDLVERVLSQYLTALNSQGTPLPSYSYEAVKTEIRDSIKAITYGFYSIREYNNRRLGRR